MSLPEGESWRHRRKTTHPELLEGLGDAAESLLVG